VFFCTKPTPVDSDTTPENRQISSVLIVITSMEKRADCQTDRLVPSLSLWASRGLKEKSELGALMNGFYSHDAAAWGKLNRFDLQRLLQAFKTVPVHGNHADVDQPVLRIAPRNGGEAADVSDSVCREMLIGRNRFD
jgi:hypothetical protein